MLPPSPTRSHLRFLTCGSVDDGKSTLIGRLLYDSGSLTDDQLAQLQSQSAQFGTCGDALDYALLLDGLMAEREQGITIDVAYKYFSTPVRKFIIADTPGHVQYTRNMVTATSVPVPPPAPRPAPAIAPTPAVALPPAPQRAPALVDDDLPF